MQLVPCVHCKRHVGVVETQCPFCAGAQPAASTLPAFAGRLTRAAIFSAAAITACDSKSATKPAPAPAPAQQLGGSAAGGSGSDDDLEKLLDTDQRTVDHPAPIDAAAVDGEAVAATTDAGVPAADAGIDPEIARKRNAERKREALERMRKNDLRRQVFDRQLDERRKAKPYGAPPARRRIV